MHSDLLKCQSIRINEIIDLNVKHCIGIRHCTDEASIITPSWKFYED